MVCSLLTFQLLSITVSSAKYHNIKENRAQLICYSDPIHTESFWSCGPYSWAPEAFITHQAALVALEPELSG